jgi:serine/threonine protein kinase
LSLFTRFKVHINVVVSILFLTIKYIFVVWGPFTLKCTDINSTDNLPFQFVGNLKIGDFGLAVTCKLWDWEEGDGGYLAPELLQEEEPSPKADIYSFGAMAYEWVTGVQLPRTRPAGEDIPRMPSWRSEALRSLVRAMLIPDPIKRPSADQIILYRKSRGANH